MSIGHKISLETSVAVVKAVCKYRIPEPVRQADLGSRAYVAQVCVMQMNVWCENVRMCSVRNVDCEDMECEDVKCEG